MSSTSILVDPLRERIAQKYVFRSRDERLISPSGGYEGWLIDLRGALLDAEMLDQITEIFWDKFADQLPFQIGGIEMSAVPLVAGLLMKARQRNFDVNGFIVRKERKPTGRGRRIEGELSDRPIVLVDDVLNSGSSLEKARVVLEGEGRGAASAFVVIDYRSERGMRWRRDNGIDVKSIFALDAFGLAVASARAPKMQEFYLKWTFAEPNAFPFDVVPKSTPLLYDDKIYVGTDSGHMVCVDLGSGRALWRYRARGTNQKGIWSSPCEHEGRIFFGAYNGDAYCLDADTGNEIWQAPLCDWIGSSPLVLPRHATVVIGLEYGRPRMRGSIAALSLESGERVWEAPVGAYQHGSAAYFEGRDLLISGTNDNRILALDAVSGCIVWSHDTGKPVKYAPAVDDERDLAVAASFDGAIYVLCATTGKLMARFQTDNICYTTPLLANGRAFCGSGDGHLYVIDLENLEMVKRICCGSRVFSSPRRVGEGAIGFGCNGGLYREIDLATFKTTAQVQLPDAITNAVIVADAGARLVIPTYMNELYCVERGTRMDQYK